MTAEIDARADESDPFAPQPCPMARERRTAVGAHDAMAWHRGVVAGAHDVADGARGQRPPGDDADEPVGGDTPAGDPRHDRADRMRPALGGSSHFQHHAESVGKGSELKDLMPRRSANPAFTDKTFEGLATTGRAMTLDGTVNRAFALVFILMAGALVSVYAGAGYWIIGAIAGLVLSLVTVFRKEWAPVTAPLYAFAEGLFVGGISVLLETAFPGIVIPAVSLTIAVFVAFLVIYRTHLIRVTDKLRIAVFAATGAVAIVYLVSLVLNLVGVQVGFLNEALAGSGVLGIAINVVVVGIAAFNLLLDFDLVERGVAARAPKYMEWYAAFALLVTLVWLYIELLRLLSRLRSR
jgi:uncharacterized YccA/Bax inhibitor family protein